MTKPSLVHSCGRFAVLACACWSLAACHEHEVPPTERDPAVLDGMELTAARRVGLESASDAMRRRDLKRLKMLSVWVRSRAQFVLFEPDDLGSLDVAIACLDGSLLPAQSTSRLEQIGTGQLLAPARALCLDETN